MKHLIQTDFGVSTTFGILSESTRDFINLNPLHVSGAGLGDIENGFRVSYLSNSLVSEFGSSFN